MSAKPKVGAIIQARMGSTRLPGKVLMDLAGKNVLEHLVERVRFSKTVDDILIATSNSQADDEIVRVASRLSISCFRGDEKEVLNRFVGASRFLNADIVVRLTGDNVFVDGHLIDLGLKKFLNNFPEIDYLNNIDECGFPFGLFIEIVKAKVLDDIALLANRYEQEHVTIKIRDNQTSYVVERLTADRDYPDVGLSLDTMDDYLRIRKIFECLYSKKTDFSLAEIANITI